MSEPKAVASSVEQVADGVWVWSVPDDRIGGSPSSAAAVESGPGEIVLVNPVRVAQEELDRLGHVTAIVLTSDHHLRSAPHYREVTGAAIWAPAGADLDDDEADDTFTDGNELPGGLKVVRLEGPRGGESAFYLKRAGGVLIVGDALINLPAAAGGLQILPEAHNPDVAGTRKSCRKLLDYDFEIVLFGHGEPIRSGGRAQLEKVLRA
ncbi:MAG: MBL fold metallo-hydrolase [Gemmatimonadetes bacterium]|nr:MBL fold metallo-hydrolase [Gemmatimonadota bacterium]